MARGSLVPVNGPMLQEKAIEIAKRLAKSEHADFKASSGWHEKMSLNMLISRHEADGMEKQLWYF